MTTLTAVTPQMPAAMGPPLPSRPMGAQAAGMSAADFFRVLRQRWILITILWVLFATIGIVGTFLMLKYRPSYAARALVYVQSIDPVNVMNPLNKERADEREVERLLQDQALLVKSPQVLAQALQDPDLRATQWFKEAERKDKEKNEDPKDLLADIVAASPVRDSNYMIIQAEWRYPKELPIIVNTVANKYLEQINEQQKIGLRKNDEQLSKELSQAKLSLENKQNEIEQFRQSEDALGKRGDDINERVSTLSALVTELDVDALGKKSQWEALQEAKPEDLPITPDLAALMENDQKLIQLELGVQDNQNAVNLLRGRYGPNHRMVREALARLETAEDLLSQERAQKVIRYQNEQVEQARRNFLESTDQLVRLKNQLDQARGEQRDHEVKMLRYNTMIEEKEQFKQQYERLMEQQHLMKMVTRQDKTVQIELRSAATEPRRVSSPRLQIWIPAAVVLGLALSVGIALLLEVTDKSVRTPRDVLRQSIPVLGTIPVTDDDEIEIERVETAALDAPHSIVAEAFRNLRANLFFSAPAEQQGVILVSSPSGGNGKTTIATNLAISIALSGRRVLLIDANMRRPGLPRIFPDMRADGLSNLLIGQARLDDLVTSTAVPGLDLLSAGPTPPNPAELLGGSYLRDLIVDARARYDQVIFDGPPVLLVSDAMVLGGAVDGVLIVCQYRTTSRGALQRTQAQLDAINARIFGAVLNRVESRAGGYFRKSYREFYEYHEAEEQAEPKRRKLDKSDEDAAGESGRIAAAGGAGVAGAAVAEGIAQLGSEPGLAGDGLSGMDVAGAGDIAVDELTVTAPDLHLESALTSSDETLPMSGDPLSALGEAEAGLDEALHQLDSDSLAMGDAGESPLGDDLRLEDDLPPLDDEGDRPTA